MDEGESVQQGLRDGKKKPRCPAAGAGSVAPMAALPWPEVVEPNLTRLRGKDEEPAWLASEVNTAKPERARLRDKGASSRQAVSEAETAGPKWAEDLRDVVKPASTVPKIGTATANLATPERNAIEPSRLKLLSNMDGPKWPPSKVNTAKPGLAKLRREGLRPMCASPETKTVTSTVQAANMGTEGSRHAKLCGKGGRPMWAGSRAGTTKPGHAWLWRGVEEPGQVPSSVKAARSRCARLWRDIVEPK